ncbi:MAG: TIR domain-containing protein [Fibromonadaceae bacterium]|jgi:hypothetical protein|nr:TIR domain-containing protein [Fibromonadaceae bacterium]
MAKKYDIFISYRRKGGVKDARLVDEKLLNSGYSVSFDIDTLGRGKFTDTLNTRLKDCKDFIVIFEPTYYERFYDENGKVQPDEVLEQDWCYLELKNALRLNKNIIPLVHKDFVFPSNLPKGVKDVAEMNAIQLTEKEFKEIFEYKVKAYLISKPKFTHRHKKSIITALLLMVLAVIAYLVSFGLESRKMAATEAARAATEAARAAAAAERAFFEADSIKKAGEARAMFVADSIRKLGDAQTQAVLDSIKAREAEKRAVVATGSGTSSQKVELYWVGNGEDTGKILFEKLSGAGLKTGKCSGNGIRVKPSESSCKPNSMGVVKCIYTPQLVISNCAGAQIEKLNFSQTFNGSNKDEALSRQTMLEALRATNFGSWVNQLQALRK